MEKENKTLIISELLKKTTFSEILKDDRFNRTIKYSTIFSFWADIVGKKFVNCTRPRVIKNSKIYVSAKSPVVIQELSLCKNNLLKKINSYSSPLGIDITDIVFDYKNYNKNTEKSDSNSAKMPELFNLNDINNVCLDKNLEEKIRESLNSIKFLSQEQKNKLVSKVISTFKVKFLQN